MSFPHSAEPIPPPSKDNSKRWQFFAKQLIHDVITGRLYIARFTFIETPLFSVKLHRIFRPDHDQELHDHPWSFLSILLWGSYTESYTEKSATLGVRFYRDVPWFNFKRAEDLHRIVRIRPCWPARSVVSLVFCGPRRRAWGFVESCGRWTHYSEFLERRANPNLRNGRHHGE